MVDIRNMDTDSIKSAADRISQMSDELMALVNDINNSVNATIPANWSGTAATRFAENWALDFAEFEKKHGNFAVLVDTLKQISMNTETAEQTATSVAQYH